MQHIILDQLGIAELKMVWCRNASDTYKRSMDPKWQESMLIWIYHLDPVRPWNHRGNETSWHWIISLIPSSSKNPSMAPPRQRTCLHDHFEMLRNCHPSCPACSYHLKHRLWDAEELDTVGGRNPAPLYLHPKTNPRTPSLTLGQCLVVRKKEVEWPKSCTTSLTLDTQHWIRG